MTLSEAQDALARIETAIAKGEQYVQFSDRSVTYRSVTELMKARELYAGQVARLGGRGKQSLGFATKGFC